MNIEDLKKQFKGELLLPEDKGYGFPDAWNLYATKVKPAFIAIPKSLSDIQELVKFAKANNVHVTARAGGHSMYSVRDGAITVDMRNFKDVHVDQNTGIVTCQTGLLLKELDAKTAPWHIPVGVIGHTGFGLIIGGGFGWTSRKYGFSVDNVIEAKIVTADGQVKTCNKKENPDLFWAILGAGSNMGILVEYKIQAHKMEKVTVNALAWPLSKEIVEKLHHFQVSHHQDRDLTTYVFLTIDKGNYVTIIQSLYFGSAEELKKMYEPLMQLSPNIVVPCT